MVRTTENISSSKSKSIMKLLKLVAFFLFISLFLFGGIRSANAAFAPWRPLCVGIQGKFVAKNWKGGPIEVGCVGDDGGATNQADQRCTGEVQVVQPNAEFRLTKCSCWGSNKGCLKVGKDITLNPLNSNNRKTITIVKRIQDTTAFKNNSCTINSTQIGNYCAANGSHLLDKNVKITCEAPPTPTRNVTNTPTPTRNPSHTPTPTPKFTSTPTPTTPICVDPDRVTNVEVTCRNCSSQGSSDETSNDEANITTNEINEGNGCIRKNPVIEGVGGVSKDGNAGQSVPFEVKVTNRDSSDCKARTFVLLMKYDQIPDSWDWDKTNGDFELSPNESKNLSVSLISPNDANSGDIGQTTLSAYDGSDSLVSTSNNLIIKYTVK